MKKKPQQKMWKPMSRGRLSPSYAESVYPGGIPDGFRVEVWANDVYEATVEHNLTTGWAYITLKRYDRHAVRDWRHLQSIKNEVVGPEREAFELFPAESRLMDTSNQYHLWVFPEGETIELGQRYRDVAEPADIRRFNEEQRAAGQRSLARQREWQPGLSTGPGTEEA